MKLIHYFSQFQNIPTQGLSQEYLDDDGSGVEDESSGSGWGAGPGPDDEDNRRGSGDAPIGETDDEDYSRTSDPVTSVPIITTTQAVIVPDLPVAPVVPTDTSVWDHDEIDLDYRESFNETTPFIHVTEPFEVVIRE